MARPSILLAVLLLVASGARADERTRLAKYKLRESDVKDSNAYSRSELVRGGGVHHVVPHATHQCCPHRAALSSLSPQPDAARGRCW